MVSGASRWARVLRILSCISGDRSTRPRNARSVRTRARTGDVVVTVAIRGASRIRAISPKQSAPPRGFSFRPFCRTSTVPSIKTKNSRPRSPSLIRVLPCGKSISSASEAISASSRFEQLENSGALRISSTLAFLRSMTPAAYSERCHHQGLVDEIEMLSTVSNSVGSPASSSSRWRARSANIPPGMRSRGLRATFRVCPLPVRPNGASVAR
jgi:hypothetical protein